MKIKSNIYSSEPIIRVGILAAPTIEFELKGVFSLNGEMIAPGNYTVTIQNAENFPQTYQPITPGSTFILKNVTIGIGFHWEQKEDQEFEGGLTLQTEGNAIRAVNEVPLESYLKSVISSEMSAMNDLNLLNAHAIVSRSWLLAQIQNKETCHPDNEGGRIPSKQCSASAKMTINENEITRWYDREDHETFDVCADDHCQRYQGMTKVISENAQKAIEATRGLVLMFNDEICDARFSKCCGGITEDFENVWQPKKVPYLVAVYDHIPDHFEKPVRIDDTTFFLTSPEAFCNTSDPEILRQVLIDFDRSTTNFFRWTIEYSQQEISDLIAKKSGFDLGEIIDIVPLERGNSGRIIRLKIIGTKREVIVGKELEIRKWLSESHLYSSAFMVEKIVDEENKIPSRFILHGAGWGHGVGMCQIGAAVMSRKGFSPEQILEHYFKGAKIKKIYQYLNTSTTLQLLDYHRTYTNKTT